jgi:Na+/H+ antiporter NhaD/arsenite permease-like protein
MLAALLIFSGTYLVLAIGRLPFFRVDRTGAAIIGATLMIAFRVLTFEEAYRAIDYDTIILLFGMMIVVANLRLSGFFRAVAAWVVEHAHRPVLLLASIVFVAGFFSAFFVNDTMCLVMTPLVLEITSALRRNPVPYLLAVATGSNIGSVATITGNPQNMMIGEDPVKLMELDYPRVRLNRVLMWKSLGISAAMIAFFFAGWPVPMVALVAGALLLVTRRVKPEKVYHEIDWPLLVMFIGLFIVVAGVEKTVLTGRAVETASRLRLDRIEVLSTVTAVLSNLLSNVPAVLLFRPLVAHLADPKRAWLTLAMASTLSGNLTLLGSVANLIVVQRARAHVTIGFWEYLKAGAPLAVATIAVGIIILR